MPPHLALLLTCVFIIWLLLQYGKTVEGGSNAAWIPLLWVLIIGSRPVSWWFESGPAEHGTDSYIEGSPLDRNIYLLLIISSLYIIGKRGIAVGDLFRHNAALFSFFLWLGLSVLWSDYPSVAFKRFFKDIGNLFMVLVLLTEKNPAEAVKTLFLRASFILIPLSVVYIRYFPDIGRYYDRFTGKGAYGGVTMNKNLLGITLAICAIALLQQIMEMKKSSPSVRNRQLYYAVLAICAMTLWLFYMADSSTSVVCAILGACILYSSKFDFWRTRLRKLWAYSFVAVAALIGSHMLFNSGALLVGILGRDLTFTGRTDIWGILLKEDVNPLLGSGFYSFWLGDRIDRLSAGYSFRLNEAHNGYLETYLNSGIIGLVLLLVIMWRCGRRLTRIELRPEMPESLYLAFFVMVAVYNITESLFNRLTISWFAFLVATLVVHSRATHVPSNLLRQHLLKERQRA